MADVSELLTGISSLYWTPGAAVLSEVSQHRPDFQMAHSGLVRLHRRCISGASGLARGVEGDPDSTCRVVRRALGDAGRYLGTTISPYLFFWQAAQEVEQEAALGLSTVEQRKGASTNCAVWIRTGVSLRPCGGRHKAPPTGQYSGASYCSSKPGSCLD